MSNPVIPSRVATLINSLLGGMCERISKLFQFPSLLHEDVSYYVNEDGLPSDEFKADLCEALSGCIGTGGGEPPNPSMPAPQNLIASDDAFSDKIQITWDPVTAPDGIDAVTSYRLYRGTTTSFGSAALITTITAPTVTYDDPVDGDLSAGTNYHYWARATNGTDTSAVSNRDQGRAASGGEIGELGAISDLRVSKGHSFSDSDPIALVFTPPAGATKFDVYRHTVNDFSLATKVISAIEPDDSTARLTSTNTPDQCWDNHGEILILHFPTSPTVHYFLWVVAKGDSPPSESDESNSSEGWVRTNHTPFTGGTLTMYRGETLEEGVDFTGGNIRVVLRGPSGGGAGGSQVYGGGGGGAGPLIVEEFVISPGDVLSLVVTPDQDETTNAPALTDGGEFSNIEFQINGVTKMTALSGYSGKFDASGGGLPGQGETGSGTAAPTIYDGKDGLPGVGAAGGAGGYMFGHRRYPAAHFNGFNLGAWSGDGPAPGFPGGGSYAAPGVEVLAVGGKGKVGFAVISFGV